MICGLFLEKQTLGTYSAYNIAVDSFSFSIWEWLQTCHDVVASYKLWQENVLHCFQLCVLMHTCSHMQINVAHMNTFWKQTF